MLNLNFTPFPRIETERTVLREMRHTDVNEYHVIRSDEELNKYINNPRPQSFEETIAVIDRMNKNVADNKGIAWTIADKTTDKMMGSICIWSPTGEEDSFEVGYSMLTEHQGKGLMREALTAAIDYGFNVMNLPLIHACTHKENEASIRLLKKAAFRRDSALEAKLTDPLEKEILVVYSLEKP